MRPYSFSVWKVSFRRTRIPGIARWSASSLASMGGDATCTIRPRGKRKPRSHEPSMILSVSDPRSAPKRLRLESAKVVLGKHPECDVVLESGKVSRRHAEIVVRDGKLFIHDLGSTNGTRLNGKTLDSESPLSRG